jgi:hypothetical protein
MSAPKPPNPAAIINGILALGILFVMASLAGLFATWLLIDRVAHAAPQPAEEIHMRAHPASTGYSAPTAETEPAPID